MTCLPIYLLKFVKSIPRVTSSLLSLKIASPPPSLAPSPSPPPFPTHTHKQLLT